MCPPATPNLVLRAWRKTQGLTRSEMAEALSDTPTAHQQLLWCSPATICKWEAGQVSWPSTRYRAALRDLTGHTATELGFTKPTSDPPATPSTSTQIRQATHTLLAGSELDINEAAGELIITNAAQPGRGYVAVSLEDGGVSWCPRCPCQPGCTGRRDYFGHLEGIITGHDDDHSPAGALPVPALMIIHLLTADTD